MPMKAAMHKNKSFAISIWTIDYISVKDNIVIGHEYFLSYKRAKKYMEKHEQDLEQEGIRMTFGVDDLWLW